MVVLVSEMLFRALIAAVSFAQPI
jgi:hypothetical protein